MGFELVKAACELGHKNDRIELNGEEGVVAVDLNFSCETNNGCLAMFAPALKSCLYMRGDGEEGGLLEGKDDNLSKLRFPAMGKAIGWSAGELFGAELTFHYGVEEKSNKSFDTTRIGKYKLECKDGGTVVIHFQAQLHPSDKDQAFLAAALRTKICTISVKPPAA